MQYAPTIPHFPSCHRQPFPSCRRQRAFIWIFQNYPVHLQRENIKKMKRPEIVQAIKSVLHKVTPTSEVILYGSEARGDAQENSDIDLLILVEKEKITNQDIINITYPLYELEEDFNYRVNISPLVYTRKQWYDRPFRTPFYINVMNEGVRLQ